MNNSVALNPSAGLSARATRLAITLLELTFALAITAIVVFAAIRGYSQSRENSKFQQASNEIGIVRAAIASRFAMNGDYTSLNNALIKPSMPSSLIDDAITPHTFANAFKGQLDVGPDQVGSASGDSFYISLTGLTSEACNRLIRADFGRDAVYMKVSNGSTPGAVAKDTALPLSDSALSAAATKCSASTLNTVAFQFSSTGQSSGGSGGSGGGGSGGGSSVPAGLGTVAGYSGSATMFGVQMLTAAQTEALVAANGYDLGGIVRALNGAGRDMAHATIAPGTYENMVAGTYNLFQATADKLGINPDIAWSPAQLSEIVSVIENYVIPRSQAATPAQSPDGGLIDTARQKFIISAVEQGALNLAKTWNPPGSPPLWVGTNIVNNNILQDPYATVP